MKIKKPFVVIRFIFRTNTNKRVIPAMQYQAVFLYVKLIEKSIFELKLVGKEP